jgi:hypothetical protein
MDILRPCFAAQQGCTNLKHVKPLFVHVGLKFIRTGWLMQASLLRVRVAASESLQRSPQEGDAKKEGGVH